MLLGRAQWPKLGQQPWGRRERMVVRSLSGIRMTKDTVSRCAWGNEVGEVVDEVE